MPQPPAERPVAGSRDPASPPMDILLIDASVPARYALRLALKAQGAEVRQASSAEQALPALRARRPDLIVAAPVLPGMNALELQELLETSGDATAPPLVIRLGDAAWPLAAAARARGVAMVSSDAELARLLPSLLPNRPRPAGSVRAIRPQAKPARPRTAPPRGPDGASPSQPPRPPAATAASAPELAPRPRSLCWRLVLASALAGLVIGAWVGWIFAH
jgi:CheY-like chemotaxis protein